MYYTKNICITRSLTPPFFLRVNSQAGQGYIHYFPHDEYLSKTVKRTGYNEKHIDLSVFFCLTLTLTLVTAFGCAWRLQCACFKCLRVTHHALSFITFTHILTHTQQWHSQDSCNGDTVGLIDCLGLSLAQLSPKYRINRGVYQLRDAYESLIPLYDM